MVGAAAMPAYVVARGDAPAARLRPSPLAGVSDEAWTRFVRALQVAALGAVTTARGHVLGCYEMRPLRLGDIGVMRGLRAETVNGARIWHGDFVPPIPTLEAFLASRDAQYDALVRSTVLYDADIAPGGAPKELGRAGGLAVLHRAGPKALASWGRRTLPAAAEFAHRAQGIF